MPRRTRAFQASTPDGSAHLVGIDNLQVLITERDGCWFAQGLEIDYAAEGRDLDDVRRAFEQGLALTIAANLRRFKTIEHLLRPAPEEVQRQAAGAIRNRYSQISTHVFPFAIQFLEAAA